MKHMEKLSQFLSPFFYYKKLSSQFTHDLRRPLCCTQIGDLQKLRKSWMEVMHSDHFVHLH